MVSTIIVPVSYTLLVKYLFYILYFYICLEAVFMSFINDVNPCLDLASANAMNNPPGHGGVVLVKSLYDIKQNI